MSRIGEGRSTVTHLRLEAVEVQADVALRDVLYAFELAS